MNFFHRKAGTAMKVLFQPQQILTRMFNQSPWLHQVFCQFAYKCCSLFSINRDYCYLLPGTVFVVIFFYFYFYKFPACPELFVLSAISVGQRPAFWADRIYSNRRRGVYFIFRDPAAAFIRGRRLFGDGVYSKITLRTLLKRTLKTNFVHESLEREREKSALQYQRSLCITA